MTVKSMQSGGKDCKTTALSPVIILSSSMLFSRRGLTVCFSGEAVFRNYHRQTRHFFYEHTLESNCSELRPPARFVGRKTKLSMPNQSPGDDHERRIRIRLTRWRRGPCRSKGIAPSIYLTCFSFGHSAQRFASPARGGRRVRLLGG